MKDESAFSSVVLPEPVPPQTSRLQRRRTARPSSSASGAVSVPLATSSSGVKPRRRKRRIVEHRPVERERRDHHVHARAVGQAGVDERLGLVDAAAERREDALDRVAELPVAREPDLGGLEPPAPLDPRRRGAADQDLVDLGVGEQRLERPEAERALGDPGHERGSRPLVEHRRLAVDERPDPLLRVLRRARIRGPREHPLAEGAGQAVERGLARIEVGRRPALRDRTRVSVARRPI